MSYESDQTLLMLIPATTKHDRPILGSFGLPEAVLLETETSVDWFVEPGRKHLCAELGGRIAEEREPADNRGFRFTAEEISSQDFSPVAIGRISGTYQGTILWTGSC